MNGATSIGNRGDDSKKNILMPQLVNQNEYVKKIHSKARQRNKIWENSKDLNDMMAPGDKNNNKFKLLLREGIPDDLRYFDRDYQKAKEMFATVRIRQLKEESHAYTAFGGIFNAERFALTLDGEKIVHSILDILGNEFPNLEYCSFLPSLVALFVHHLSPDDALSGVRVLVRKSLSSRTWVYFPTNLPETMTFHAAFKELLKLHSPKVYKHIKQFGEFAPIWTKWLDNFMLDVLSLPAAFRLLDSFIQEGYKVIYRYCLAVLTIRSSDILKCKDTAQIERLFETSPCGESQADEDKLSQLAFSFKFTRQQIEKSMRDHQDNFLSFTTTSSVDDSRKHAPKLFSNSEFVKPIHWEYIWTWIPRRYKSLDVEMIFSTNKHGYNLNTFYGKCSEKEPQILFVETTDGLIFGAYLSESWEGNTTGSKFFGTAETFLFSLSDNAERKYEWVGLTVKPDEYDKLKDINENASLFIFGSYKYLAVGGGGNHFGLSLDEDLSKGTTGKCLTFANEPLTGKPNGLFQVRTIEVWTFK